MPRGAYDALTHLTRWKRKRTNSMSIKRNTLYNLIGSVGPSVVTLITVPVYLRLIGVERYGILVIFWVFLGYFGVFDLGLGRATAQRIATLRHAEPKERAEVFWTALMLNAFFGVAGGLLLWPVAQIVFSSYFHVAEPLRLEILAAVPWLAAALPVATISGVLGGALQGRERFLALNISNVLGVVLFQVLPLSVAWFHGPDIAWLIPAALLGRVVVFGVLFAQCYKYVPLDAAPSVKRDLVAPLFRYGGWVTVTSFVAPLLDTLDRFLIGSIAGAKAVAYYTVPFSLLSRVSALPWSLSNVLFPKFSVTSGEERDQLTDEAIRALSVILTPLIIVGILLMEPFLAWWVGPELARNSSTVGEIIAFGVWFNALAYIPYARLQAQGRPDLVAKCQLAELLPYLGLLAVALYAWGVRGAAAAWSMRVIVDAALLFWMGGLVSRDLKVYLLPILLLGATMGAVLGFPLQSVFRWVAGAGSLLGSLAWAWWASPESVKKLIGSNCKLLTTLVGCRS